MLDAIVDIQASAAQEGGSAAHRPRLAGKRAAVVVFSYYPSDPRVRREAEALKEAGVDLDVFCLQGENEPRNETVSGIRVHRLPLQRKRGGKLRYFYQYGVFLLLSFLSLARRTITGPRFHLVHVHNMPDVLVFAGLIPKLFGARVILDLHDPTPEVYTTIYRLSPASNAVRFLHRIEQLSIGFADLGITPNIAFKELFVQRGCPPDKMLLVMNSPQTEVFDRARSKPLPKRKAGEFHLMFHGSLLERHGLDDLIDAVASLRSRLPGLRLNIYGSRTQYVDVIEQKIASLQLNDIVSYHGGKPLEDIARLIRTADLGVIPNKRSPFTEINMPTRIFEYLEMHTPVIAPRTKGVMDYFAEDQIVYFDPGNSRDLADKILWVCSHPESAAEKVRLGREVYLPNNWPSQKAALVQRVSALLQA